MGVTGDQVHIGKVNKLDAALKSGFLNNIVVACQAQGLSGSTQIERSALPAFTIYLSNSSSTEGWSDDQVISARSTAAGGGNVSLSAKRVIRTDVNEESSSLGPVHIWAEATDVPVQPNTNLEARFTIEAWGRMILLTSDTG